MTDIGAFEKTEGILLPCPMCFQSFTERRIRKHLDLCLTECQTEYKTDRNISVYDGRKSINDKVTNHAEHYFYEKSGRIRGIREKAKIKENVISSTEDVFPRSPSGGMPRGKKQKLKKSVSLMALRQTRRTSKTTKPRNMPRTFPPSRDTKDKGDSVKFVKKNVKDSSEAARDINITYKTETVNCALYSKFWQKTKASSKEDNPYGMESYPQSPEWTETVSKCEKDAIVKITLTKITRGKKARTVVPRKTTITSTFKKKTLTDIIEAVSAEAAKVIYCHLTGGCSSTESNKFQSKTNYESKTFQKFNIALSQEKVSNDRQNYQISTSSKDRVFASKELQRAEYEGDSGERTFESKSKRMLMIDRNNSDSTSIISSISNGVRTQTEYELESTNAFENVMLDKLEVKSMKSITILSTTNSVISSLEERMVLDENDDEIPSRNGSIVKIVDENETIKSRNDPEPTTSRRSLKPKTSLSIDIIKSHSEVRHSLSAKQICFLEKRAEFVVNAKSSLVIGKSVLSLRSSRQTVTLSQSEEVSDQSSPQVPMIIRVSQQLLPNVTQQRYHELLTAESELYKVQSLVPCECCGRTFARKAHARHYPICISRKTKNALAPPRRVTYSLKTSEKDIQINKKPSNTNELKITELNEQLAKKTLKNLKSQKISCKSVLPAHITKLNDKQEDTNSTAKTEELKYCYGCKQKFQINYLKEHIQNCGTLKKRSKFCSLKKKIVKMQNCTSTETLQQKLKRLLPQPTEKCPFCKRAFSKVAASRHIPICERIKPKQDKEKVNRLAYLNKMRCQNPGGYPLGSTQPVSNVACPTCNKVMDINKAICHIRSCSSKERIKLRTLDKHANPYVLQNKMSALLQGKYSEEVKKLEQNPKPKLVSALDACRNCGRRFSKASTERHLLVCKLQKRGLDSAQAVDGKLQQGSMVESRKGKCGGWSLTPCPICNRRFTPMALERHFTLCQKIKENERNRKQYIQDKLRRNTQHKPFK